MKKSSYTKSKMVEKDMEKESLSKISEEMGASISTVSKTLNHCSGVDSATREFILRAAGANHSSCIKGSVDVYVMLPETPTFFWRKIFKELSKALESKIENKRIKYNLYTKFTDSYAIGSYVEEAKRLDVRLIIAAVQDCPESQKIFAQSGIPTFFMFGGPHLVNSFFFGSDLYENGRIIAEEVMKDCALDIPTLICGTNDPERNKGFFDSFSGETFSLNISNTAFDKCFSAILARNLAKVYQERPFGAVVCLDGFSSKICLAIKKASIPVKVYGVEKDPECAKYYSKELAMTVSQNTVAVVNAVAEATKNFLNNSSYPGKKFIYADPIIEKTV